MSVPMSDHLSFNAQGMTQASTAVDKAFDRLFKVKKSLRSDKAELMSHWTGISAAAFSEAFEEFDQEFEIILKDLTKINYRLREARTKYENYEQDNTEQSERINRLLNG
jgi:WXG100 family type VII secretion target